MHEFQEYVRAWRGRWKREQRTDAGARRKARACASKLALLLAQRYRARRVLLCGSLARGDFQRGSDIDLVIEGISKDRFFEASAEAANAAGEFEVDLVPMEAATASFRRRLAREGIVLHDASRT